MSRKVRRITIPELEDAPDAISRKWLPKDEIILATYYGKKSPGPIAKYLKRTVAGLQHHARDMGLSYQITDEERERIIQRLQEENPE